MRGFSSAGLALAPLFFVGLPGGAESRVGTAMRATVRMHTTMKASGMSEPFTPEQILFASSPKEGKIVYAILEHFEAVGGRTFPLVDAGLMAPMGIALDRTRGYLYVCDFDARKLYQYKLRIKPGGKRTEVLTDGDRVEVMTNIKTRWCTVTQNGDLLFSNEDTNAINKIKFVTIQRLRTGEIHTGDLVVQTQQIQQEMEAAKLAAEQQIAQGVAGVTMPVEPPYIYALYDAGSCADISQPSGMYTDGVNIFWGNYGNGEAKGSVVQGKVDPEKALADASASNPSKKLAVNTNTVRGVVKTHKSLVYADETNKVYSVSLSGGPVYTMTDTLDTPRGLVWDGDNTIYVADSQAGRIWSFPSGRLSNNQPLLTTVDLFDAFGLALLTEKDAAYSKARAARGSAACAVAVALLLLGSAGIADPAA